MSVAVTLTPASGEPKAKMDSIVASVTGGAATTLYLLAFGPTGTISGPVATALPVNGTRWNAFTTNNAQVLPFLTDGSGNATVTIGPSDMVKTLCTANVYLAPVIAASAASATITPITSS